MRKSITCGIIVSYALCPSIALAWQDMPTAVTTVPAFLCLLLPFIAYEIRTYTKLVEGHRKQIAIASVISLLLTIVAITLIGRLHFEFVYRLFFWTHQMIFGISSLDFMEPNIGNILYHFTIGSAFLIQRNGWLNYNIIVIASSFIPMILSSLYITKFVLRLTIGKVDSAKLIHAVSQVKLVEYLLTVAGAMIYLKLFWPL